MSTGRSKEAKAKIRQGNTQRFDREEMFRLRAQGLSQHKIGRLLGCSSTHVARVLNGRANDER